MLRRIHTLLILLLCLLMTSYPTWAAISLSGTILDQDTQQPIPYVFVSAEAQGVYLQANAKGKFSVLLGSTEGSISFKALGYTLATFSIQELQRQMASKGELKLYLQAAQAQLGEVEIKAKPTRWKTTKAGFNIDQGSPFQRLYSPTDSLGASIQGQEIGTNICVRRYPASLQSMSFGLAGSGALPLTVRVHVYALQNGQPQQDLLSEPAIVYIPPHYTGWVTVDLLPYHLTIHQDFAITIEWLNGASRLNDLSLLTFARMPKQQRTYYRASKQQGWQQLPFFSIGMYATLLHE